MGRVREGRSVGGGGGGGDGGWNPLILSLHTIFPDVDESRGALLLRGAAVQDLFMKEAEWTKEREDGEVEREGE